MINTQTDYLTAAECSATLLRQVSFLCWDGRIDEAASLISSGDDPEMLLARGIVQYWHASSGKGSHEEAKNTLTRAFESVSDRNLRLFAQIFIGLCYSRQGQPQEAAIRIAESAREASDDLTRFVALLSFAVLDLEDDAWRPALEKLAVLVPMVDSIPNESLKGRFFLHRGLAYKLAGQFDHAIWDYEAALECFERSRNDDFQARVLNNIGTLYIPIDCERAHINIDPAISLFRRLGNQLELAQAYETKAQIYLQELDFRRALGSVNQAMDLLGNDQQLWLPDFLCTQGRAFAGLRQIPEALAAFNQASERAELMGDKEAAGRCYLTAITALSSQLSVAELIDFYRQVHRLCPDTKTESALKIMERVVFASSLPELEKTSDAQESEIIRHALEQAHGSIRRAARLMQIPRNTLAFKIGKHRSELAPYLKPPRRSITKK